MGGTIVVWVGVRECNFVLISWLSLHADAVLHTQRCCLAFLLWCDCCNWNALSHEINLMRNSVGVVLLLMRAEMLPASLLCCVVLTGTPCLMR